MKLFIIVALVAAIIVLIYIGVRSRKTRTLRGGSVIGDTIERPTRPFDKR